MVYDCFLINHLNDDLKVKKLLKTVCLFYCFSDSANSQPGQGFNDVFSNSLILPNILQYLSFQGISSFRTAVGCDSSLLGLSELILSSGLHVIRTISPRRWLNYAYRSYLSEDGDWQVRGTPQAGMVEYSTDREFEIKRVISYSEGERDEAPWVMFGELHDGSAFHFSASCDYTGFDCQGGGVITYAPNWVDLLNNLSPRALDYLIGNLNTSDEFIALLLKNKDCPEILKRLFIQALNQKT
ncbi:hypothetical protein [Endozoicomonas sp. 8E]|uniref:hypothetical protein n=1 Tax=Endozoicomonas sp. 8E TaxID=3035692 RepID=UPI00293915D5|nr:hypothetical protein [Endozoicomonas sp. 8E]WOG30146.1 hypothetical protein P6910_10980 [Endozoicomonas sp. 8E]